MKNNSIIVADNSIFYKTGVYIILTLPLIAFNPFFWPPSWTQTIILRIITTILGLIIIYQFLFKYKKINLPNIKNNPIIWAFLLFFSVFLLSSLFSIDPYFSFWSSPERGEGFVNLLFLGLFAFILFLLTRSDIWKKIWTFVISVGAVMSFLSILSFFGFAPQILSYFNPRLGASLGNPITFGIYLLMLLFIATSFFLVEKERKKKIFFIATSILFLFCLFLTGSRGAYLGFLAGLFYFLIFYPAQKSTNRKIILGLRISALVVFLGVVAIVLYATYTPKAIPLISENGISKIILPRLSLNFLAKEERFRTWSTVIEVIKEKSILGWGLENMSVGFDKHFDPMKTPLGWWDRSHNTFLDATASAGILGLIAYIGLFVAIFWQLQKFKKTKQEESGQLNNDKIAHGMQAMLIGYAVANLFSIDSFTTLLIFFLLAAFTASLNNKTNQKQESIAKKSFNVWQNLSIGKKRTIFLILVILSSIFIWQYNIKPLFLNSELNTAKIMSQNNLCDKALEKIEEINLPKKILGQYGVLESVEIMRNCIRENPGLTMPYSQKSLQILERSLPQYSLSNRLWKLAGSISSTIAVGEQNPDIKSEYLNKSQQYYEKALTLSPKSQEIILGMAYINIIKKDCQSATNRANQCVELNPAEGSCYWTRASSLICEGNLQKAEEDIEKAKSLNFNPKYDSSVQQLINAYLVIENYEKIAELYEFLITKDAYNIQYRASLAESYRLIGNYEKARFSALKIIEVLPGTRLKIEEQQAVKKSVEAFLQTLPPQYQLTPPEYK